MRYKVLLQMIDLGLVLLLVGCTMPVASITPLPSTPIPPPPTLTSIPPTSTSAPSVVVVATVTTGVTPKVPEPSRTPDGLVTIVNADGFDCAVSMAINLLEQDNKTSCESIKGFLRTWEGLDIVPGKYRDSVWFVNSLNTYFTQNKLPYKAEHRQGVTTEEIIRELQEGDRVNIAAVQLHTMLHAVVLVGYDPSKDLVYLDSLHSPSSDLPSEADFLKEYGEKFQDVWHDTYSISKAK